MTKCESDLQTTLSAITPYNHELLREAQARLDGLTKPIGSLGRLEELAARYVAIAGNISPSMPKPVVFTLAADHGVTEEGVSAYPRSVTAQMVKNFLHGGAAVNVFARHAGASVRIVDMGVAEGLGAPAGLINKKVGPGTNNFAQGPAMTRAQAIEAIVIGIDLAKAAHADGMNLIAVGDMGIGNTSASAAIASVMTDRAAGEVTGRGTGVSDEDLTHKIKVIEQAIHTNNPDPQDPLDVLAKVGGFEIAGIAGIILGAAVCKVPVLLDGFITGASALIAVGLQPLCREYVIASHVSVEPGHRVVLEKLHLEPLFDLHLRLGEGTGACLGITLIQAALKMYTQMATFQEARVDEALSQETGSPVRS